MVKVANTLCLCRLYNVGANFTADVAWRFGIEHHEDMRVHFDEEVM